MSTWYSAHTFTGSGPVVRFWYVDSSVTLPIHAELTGSCHTVGFQPFGDSPLPAGVWRLEVWHAGRLLGSTQATIAPPTALAIGAIMVGTSAGRASGCGLGGNGVTFPSSATRLYFRFNWAGTGEYRVRILKDGALADFVGVLTPSAGGCYRGDYSQFSPGSWTIDVTDKHGRSLRRSSFTVG
ncbi:MAG: hypothetical protein EXR52_03810 [Dehalococcoidia bacterium]|nr:hypothetical protein [Dehalococcoidia bacterium]